MLHLVQKCASFIFVASMQKVKHDSHLLLNFTGIFYECFTREYLTIYGGPGFLAVFLFGSTPALALSRQQIISLPVCRRSSLLTEEGGGGIGGAKS
jgi:hypothetical protein